MEVLDGNVGKDSAGIGLKKIEIPFGEFVSKVTWGREK